MCVFPVPLRVLWCWLTISVSKLNNLKDAFLSALDLHRLGCGKHNSRSSWKVKDKLWSERKREEMSQKISHRQPKYSVCGRTLDYCMFLSLAYKLSYKKSFSITNIKKKIPRADGDLMKVLVCLYLILTLLYSYSWNSNQIRILSYSLSFFSAVRVF